MSHLAHQFLNSSGFHPHGYCYLWKPGLIWLHVISDGLIGLAYVAIGLALAYFVRSGRGDIPFSRMFVAFGVFIAACGATHFVEIWTLWQPVYWFAGGVKVVTAAASVFTAIALPPLVPVALGTTRAAKVSEKRRLELEAANAELNTLYAKLREADEAKTRFFANVSHELRTPLALILGPTESLLEAGNLPESDRHHAETVHRNAQLLLTHVNDLLDISKLEAGHMDVHYARADLTRIVRLAASHFESLAQQRQTSYTVQTPETLPAELDPDKIGRVLFNLLGNAFKFTPVGGRIRCILGTRESAGNLRATLAVHDSGPGIAAEQREVVFEPFRSTSKAGGTGLGLAIVKEFVELHGGTVSASDSPDGGALLSVELPLQAPPGTEVLEDWIEPAGFGTQAAHYIVEEQPAQTIAAEPSAGDSDRPLEAGRETVSIEAVQIAVLVRESSDVTDPLARDKGLAFLVDVEQAPSEICTNAGKRLPARGPQAES